MIQQPWGKKTLIATFHPIVIDGKEIEAKAIEQGGSIYVPIWAIASSVSSSINWNESEKLVSVKAVSIPGVVYGDVIYGTLAQAQKVFSEHLIQVKSYGE